MMPTTVISASSDTGHLTKQQYVYGRLRRAILTCDLQPGERLVIDDVARRFAVSIIPVREAIRLLQSEGLVTTVAHVGATVAPMSEDAIAEVFAILEGLEAVGTRVAAERATDADLDALAALLHAMDEALEEHDPARWADMNTEFHLAIGAIARMPVLQDMLQRAFDRWMRVRHFYFSGVLVRRAAQAQAEHRDILAMMRQRDYAGLEQVIRRHNRDALVAYAAHHRTTATEAAQ
jgi:DNA-binding GntR family transcriptional regulator